MSEGGKIIAKLSGGVKNHKCPRGVNKTVLCPRGVRKIAVFSHGVEQIPILSEEVTEIFLSPSLYFNGIALRINKKMRLYIIFHAV